MEEALYWTPGSEPEEGMLIGSWLCESRIGQGAYGRVYAVVHNEKGLKGALKMRWPQEPKERKHRRSSRTASRGALAQLKFELISYRHLSDVDSPVFPRLLEPAVHTIPEYSSHVPDDTYYFVMERLGTSLERSRIVCAETLGSVGEQLVRGLRLIHSKGLVNKDINPENLCWGLTESGEDDYARVCMIDLGMLQYRDRYQFLGCDEGKPDFTGTAYMAGEGYSYRDDLEAVGLTLAHLHGVKLPWAGLYPMTRKATKKEIHKILDMRRADPGTYLKNGHAAAAIAEYLRRIQQLDVSTPIDYDALLAPLVALRPPPVALSLPSPPVRDPPPAPDRSHTFNDYSQFLANWLASYFRTPRPS